MIHFIGSATENSPQFRQGTWDEFYSWINSRREFEFDIETTVTPWWCDKKIRTLAFGNPSDQWVIQWSAITHDADKENIKHILESEYWTKIIHNGMFECVVMLFEGIRIRHVIDTMLAEQVLFGGEKKVEYGLDDMAFRRLGIVLDKSYQTAFNEDILTPGHIRYAAQDVKYLTPLKKEIYHQIQAYGLEWTLALECEVLLAFAEMTYNGMEIDKAWWLNLLEFAEPLVGEAQAKLNEYLTQPEFAFMAYDLGYISDNDRLLLNWNSHKQIKAVFSVLFPELPGTTKAVLKKYISDRLKNQQEVPEWLHEYSHGNTQPITDYLMQQHRQFLIDSDLLIPAGTATINWNSVAQALPIIQCIAPRITDLSEETLGRVGHPIIKDYQEFKEMLKLTSSYGEKFINEKVEPDGKVRTRFNQVLTTGRVASSSPNMQQIPAKDKVGNKYRNAFIPPAGRSFVSSDYISQELVVIAYLSQDPVWIDALNKGQDLHSICAELVFKKRWREAADEGCQYYHAHVDKDGKYWPANSRLKCKCKKHKPMRDGIKTINFGLAYGMSEFKLASEMRIPVPEAKHLIIEYFLTFPGIGKLLTFLGHFGLDNGYIQTIWPFYRRRWFPDWRYYTRFIDTHKMGAQYHPGLGEIERASKNMPIQGTSADMMKTALCLIYWEIHDVQKISDKVSLVMQVHDQADTNVDNDFKDIWAPRQNALMNQAAKFIIPTGILKTDTTITERWSK